jgi:hypothetical protein
MREFTERPSTETRPHLVVHAEKRGVELLDLESVIALRLGERAALEIELADTRRKLDMGRRVLAELESAIAHRRSELSDADGEIDLLYGELSNLESAIARRQRELADTSRQVELGRGELSRLQSAVGERRREPADPQPTASSGAAGVEPDADRIERKALTEDLRSARDLVDDGLSRSADIDETRKTVRQAGRTLARAVGDDRVWAHLDRTARRAQARRVQLRMAADIEWSPLLRALGRSSSSLDVLTLNRDVAIEIHALLSGEGRVDVGAARGRLRALADASMAEYVDRSGLHQLGRALVFVLTRLRLLVGLADLGATTVGELVPEVGHVQAPGTSQAVAAILTGALLHGVDRAGQPAGGDACWRTAVHRLTSTEFDDLASRWDELAADRPDVPAEEVVEATTLFLGRQLAHLHLAYEATITAPSADLAMQASSDELRAVLREARAQLEASPLDARRVSETLRRCQARARQAPVDGAGVGPDEPAGPNVPVPAR